MYKIDPKYFNERNNFNFKDPKSNPIKFMGFEKEVINGVTFYIGATPIWNERLQQFTQERTFSFLSTDGVELCCLEKNKFNDIKFNLDRIREERDESFNKLDRDNYLKMLERRKLGIVLNPIIEAVAKEPELAGHIPVEAYMQRPTLAEEILTAYQRVKMEQLQKLPAGQDCGPFVEEIKSKVETMNKTFNNIEKTRKTKESFADFFKRDKER